MKSISWFALWGAMGFGIGGATGGIISPSLDVPYLGFPILGFFGGASLGLASKNWKRAGFLALAGSIGFGVGFLLGFLILFAIWEPPYVKGLFLGAIVGGLGGACLSLVLKGWGRIGPLALAGAAGFGVAMQFIPVWRSDSELLSVLGWGPKFSIWGIVGGAILGATLGYLERRKTNGGG